MNPNNNFDNFNFQDNFDDMDDPLNTDNLLNEEEEPNINLNINNPDLEYVTDSDITNQK